MKLLRDYFGIKNPQNLYPEFGLHQLELCSNACDKNYNPPPRTILVAAILLTVIGERNGRQKALDIFFQNHIEVHSE